MEASTESRPSDPTRGVDSAPNHFDLLRLVFASLVILSHSPELVDGNRSRELLTRAFGTISFGELGVAGFFVLSGYLIVQSWERTPRVWPFLRKRIARIYPGYLVAALLGGLVFGPLGAASVEAYFAKFDWLAFARSSLLLEVPVTPETKIGNGSLWTIQIEFRCYLAVLLGGLLGLFRWRYVGMLLFAVFAARFFAKGVLFAPYTLYGYFCAGVTCFLLRDRIRYTRTGVVIATVLLLPMMFHPILAWVGLCTCGAYLLFALAFARIPALPTNRFRTDVSYGTYLYAWPLQSLIIQSWPGVSPWVVFALALPASLLAGWLSWHLVEKRFFPAKGERALAATPSATPPPD